MENIKLRGKDGTENSGNNIFQVLLYNDNYFSPSATIIFPIIFSIKNS